MNINTNFLYSEVKTLMESENILQKKFLPMKNIHILIQNMIQ